MKNPFIIAEIGSNHDGKIEQAKELILTSKKCGANAVKFQLFKNYEFSGLTKNQYAEIKKYEFPDKWINEIIKFTNKLKIELIFSVFGNKSLNLILKYNLKYIKIASSEIINYNLLSKVANKFDNVILSTGMSNETDIIFARDILRNFGNKNITVLHCVADYPTRLKDLNFEFIDTLKNFKFNKIGFSDHTLDNIASIVAVGKGCTVFEKHITLDKKNKGPDHFYALEPNEFKAYVNCIKKAYSSLGANKKIFSADEKKYGRRRGIYVNKNLKKNYAIKITDIVFKNPALGIRDYYADAVINKKLKKNLKKNSPLKFEDLD
tara:strand:+ start:29 stop:991 length:963 start_codon:yes stop_codon:yes gene_type:complete